jgi:D-glycero-D-manno-heptose 1,7-bisphosphate phosphatase
MRHLILDRDGVLNRESASGYVLEPDQWQWEPRALAALRVFARHEVRVSIATNQSCIGRGYVSFDAIERVHAEMLAQASAAQARIAALFVCPHAPEASCSCRKPKPGLLLQALAATSIPPEQTLVVGDASTDVEAALSAGLSVALVRTGKGRATEARPSYSGVAAYDDLWELARALYDAS